MSSLIHNDDEFAPGDRELTLSTGAILASFLGLVLLCGGFFGFGYRMGSHKAGPPVEPETSASASAAAPVTDFNVFKPAPGSPANASSRPSVTVRDAATESGSHAESTPTVVSPRSSLAADPSAPAHTPAPTAVHLGASSNTSNGAPGSAATGNFVVQIAAVSLQEDANLLAGALRSRGYTVSAHAEPDKLIHIQVGPFATRKEADAMRQRLLSDGYNAIVK
jgi:DedD protein